MRIQLFIFSFKLVYFFNVFMIRLLSLVFVLFVWSCNKSQKFSFPHSKQFSVKDFKKKDYLHGEVLDLGLLVSPISIFCNDSNLFVYQAGQDTLLTVYSTRENYKKMGRAISQGMGPGEMMTVNRMDFNSDGSIWVHDVMGGQLKKFQLLSNDGKLNVKVLDHIKIPGTALNAVYLNSDLIITTTREIVPPTRFSIYDKLGRIIEQKGAYPYYGTEIPVSAAVEVFSAWAAVHPAKNGFVLAYEYTDLLEFYDSTATLIRRLHGPDRFFPVFELKQRGNYPVMKRLYNKTKYAYPVKPVGGKEMICFLYADGKTVPKGDDEADHFNKVIFTDWNGSPLALYELDKKIISIAVDWTARKIYGLNRNEAKVFAFSF